MSCLNDQCFLGKLYLCNSKVLGFFFQKSTSSVLYNLTLFVQPFFWKSQFYFAMRCTCFWAMEFPQGWGGGGHWAVNYTGNQSLLTWLCYSMDSLGILLNFDCNVSTNNFNLQKGLSCLSPQKMYINILFIVLSLKIPEFLKIIFQWQTSRKIWV